MQGKLSGYTQDTQRVSFVFTQLDGSTQKALIDIISPEIVNVYVAPTLHGIQHFEDCSERSFAIENLIREPCSVRVSQNDGAVLIDTGLLHVLVSDNCMIDIFDTSGTLLCADYRGARDAFKRRGGNEALAAEEGHETQKENEYPVYLAKELNADTAFYGLGERTGSLNKRGYHYKNWNTDNPAPHTESFEQLYKSIPFFIALSNKKAYGILFDNTFETHFDLGKENNAYYYCAAVDGALDYYFINGPHIADVLRRYTDLTGRMPLPQEWTLGFHQSRWSYTPASRVAEIAREFRARRIPCDAVHLDIDYMDGYRVFTWGKKEFLMNDYASPEAFLADLAKVGFKAITIIDPGVKKDAGYFMFDEGIEHRYFATDTDNIVYVNRVWPGNSVYPDFTNTAVRDWWASKQRLLTDVGVAGIWNDMNEPASFNGPLPLDVLCNKDGKRMAHCEWHNVYGSLMCKATFDGIKEATNKRPYVITRACFAGVQKYATVWTGDNHSTWEHLRMSIPMLQNLGLSGLPFCGADVGGFSFDCTGELLIRWIQVGAFSPFFRNHSAMGTRSQEVWEFGEDVESICRSYIELRYTLLPYLYDAFKKCECSGLSVMRPLVCDFQEDERAYNINDQFLWGSSFLLAPVLEQGIVERVVYFPKGAEWVDFWTGEVHAGGSSAIAYAPREVCPLYVKQGSIIPRYEVQQYVGEKTQTVLQLDIYVPASSPVGEGVQTTYTHYQDDGESYAYKDGAYNEYSIMADARGVCVCKTHAGYEGSYKEVLCRIHTQDAQGKTLLIERSVMLSSNSVQISL